MNVNISKISVNGFSMDYFSFGSGETPFVMLPGIYTKPTNTLAYSVAAAYKAFAEKFTVYVFDRRTPITDGYTIEDTALDTAAVLDEIGIKKACVFGVSMGGMTAQALAVKRPDLVGRLVLVSTASRISAQTNELLDRFIELAQSGDPSAMSLEFAKAVYTPSFFEQFKDAIIASLSGSTNEDIDRFIKLTKAIKSFDIYAKLDSISCPTLVIGAQEDKLIHVQAAHDIAQKTGAELCIYEGYGHAVYDEAPDIKDKLFEFFQGKGELI